MGERSPGGRAYTAEVAEIQPRPLDTRCREYSLQSNRLETDSSREVRPAASPINSAIDSTRMLRDTRTASVAWIESVITSSLSFEAVMRATAPPDSTPCVI